MHLAVPFGCRGPESVLTYLKVILAPSPETVNFCTRCAQLEPQTLFGLKLTIL